MLRMRIAAGAMALATAGFACSSAWAASTTVSASRTTALNMSGSDTLNITATGVFTLSGTAVTINNASTSALTITNLGTLNSTTNRAIRINDSTGNAATNAHSMTVINGSSTNSTALIQAGDATHTGDDAIQSSNALNGGTIEIDNYGTIYSNGNRAINLTAATGGTVTINNYATGVIKAVGSKDVVRPASGSTIYNYGKIQSTDESTQGNRNDAIDFQSNATDTVYGTVYNYTGGLIEGAKHGITGNIGKSNAYYIENDANAAITGLNGSGINLDIPDDIAAIADDVQKRAAVALLKTATVVNYGTITGEAHDATGTDTDGDGIDIDSVVSIDNYGTVQALGAIGNKDGNPDDPNISDGLAIGGGTVNNYASGVIYSVGRGIQVDDSEAGAEFAATKIYNEGKIQGGILAINIVGDLADTLVNKGTIIGNVFMGGGDDTVSLYTGQSLTGTLDGGDGTGDTVKLESATSNATGSLSNVVNFEKLAVDGGTWSLTDDQSYSSGTTVADGATLKANATLTSAVTVDAGGTLGGTGTVASIDAYGTVAPGSSIGTLSTTGDVVFETGSTYAVEANDTPAADFLSVGGTASLAGGTVDVTALTGTWANYNKVAILTANGGILSNFGGLTDDASSPAFLDAALDYEGNSVYLVLTRNDVDFGDVAATPNQHGVAGAINDGGSSSGLYSYLLSDSQSEAQADLDALSGETYASNAGTLADQSALIADTLLSRFQAPPSVAGASPLAYGGDTRSATNAAANAIADAPVYSAWAKGFGQSLALKSDGNAGGVNGGVGGGLLGMDVTASGIRAGIAAGYASASSDVAARSSTSNMQTGILAAYAGTETGVLRVRGGASYGWSSVDTKRTATVGSLTEHSTASYDATAGNAFLEAARPYALAGLDLEPFAGVAYTSVSQGAFTEKNAPVTGLSSDAQSFDNLYSTLGLRWGASFVAGDMVWRNHAMVGWRHAYGDLTPERTMTFADTGASFLVAGTPIAGDSAVVEAGVDVAAGASTTVGVAYSGALSGSASSHAVKLSGAVNF